VFSTNQLLARILITVQQTQSLQKMPNRFIRLIRRLPFGTPITSMLDKLGWLSVKQRMVFNAMRFLYRIENENMPPYLKRRLIRWETSYGLRDQDDYVLPNFRKHITQDCLFYDVLDTYNRLKKDTSIWRHLW
jgi:hypothetical protein